MNSLHQKNKFYDLVFLLLKEYPELRDSDARLQHRIWKLQHIDLNDENEFVMTAKNGETIRRTRQKIQELHPELRSSKKVQELKDNKESTKSTFVYRETVEQKAIDQFTKTIKEQMFLV